MQFKLGILNVNGLTRKKEPEIECIVHSELPEILFLVETHRNDMEYHIK